jgi:hypothetical protein
MLDRGSARSNLLHQVYTGNSLFSFLSVKPLFAICSPELKTFHVKRFGRKLQQDGAISDYFSKIWLPFRAADPGFFASL